MTASTLPKPPAPSTFIQQPVTYTSFSFLKALALLPVFSVFDTMGGSGNENEATQVRVIGSWNMKMSPVKKKMMNGHLIPTAKGLTSFFNSRVRHVVIEIHSPGGKESRQHPMTPSVDPSASLVDDKEKLEDRDHIVVRVLKRVDDNEDDESSVMLDDLIDHQIDDEETATQKSRSLRQSTVQRLPALDNTKHWVERNRFLFANISIHSVHGKGKIIEIRAGAGPDSFTRDLKFATLEEAQSFLNTINDLKRLDDERAKRQLEEYKREHAEDTGLLKTLAGGFTRGFGGSQTKDSDDGKINLLIEIVSAKNLPASDFLLPKLGIKERMTKTSKSISKAGKSVAKKSKSLTKSIAVHKSSTTESPKEIAKKVESPRKSSTTKKETKKIESGGSSDPYVIVRMGGDEIHRTSVLPKTLDPIWTLYTGSLFVLSTSPEMLFTAGGGLVFVIKDSDQFGGDDPLGKVTISVDELLTAAQGGGKRKGYKVVAEKDMYVDPEHPPMLYLRIRKAQQSDITFMKEYEQHKGGIIHRKAQGIHNNEVYLPPRALVDRKLSHLRKHKTLKHEEDKTKERIHRVKPCPDPKRVEETKWMNDQQIDAESEKPSTNWIEAGSGKLGKLYVEILRCDHLPNMDTVTLLPLDKTDAFACFVYEDSVVCSDVIPNCLSPRWLPWTNRAFAFNISHPASKMFLGVFDQDPMSSPVQQVKRAATNNLHDSIGRVMVNLSRFVPGTVYNLTYPIYKSGLSKIRQEKDIHGTITIRVRIEYKNVQKAISQSMLPPPTQIVSQSKSTDFELTRYAVGGMKDYNAWSLKTFTGHIDELQSYDVLLDYVTDAAMTVLFWRGHHKATVCGKSFMVPAHSMCFFTWMCLVSWNFNLFFSFVLFSVGWFMLAVNYQVRTNPSPWHQCSSYLNQWSVLVFGGVPLNREVPSDFKKEEFKQYMADYNARVIAKEKEKKLEEQLEQEYLKEQGQLEDGGEIDIETNKEGIIDQVSKMVNPIRLTLHPIQIELGKIVIYVRMAKSIILWRENHYAFWITTASLLSSIVALFLPWGFLLRWALRIVLVGGTGPWMMIVDKKYFAGSANETEEQKVERLRAKIKEKYGAAVQQAETRQIEKERQLKLQAMASYMYGDKIVRVPHFNEHYFSDLPLPVSSSVRYNPNVHGRPQIASMKYGQKLTGDMIPNREIQEVLLAKQESTKNVSKSISSAKAAVAFASKLKKPLNGGKKASETTPLLADSKLEDDDEVIKA